MEGGNSTPGTPPAEVKSFQERLSEIPMYSMTLSQLASVYTSLKDRNQVLNQAFTTGEKYFSQVSEAAKPVVISATETALKVVQPVVGKIDDPVGKIDQCASEALAKVQEKLPIVKKTPAEIASDAKTTAHDTASYYYNKLSGSNIGKQTTQHLDNAVSFSELMVEICFPTDGTNPDDLKELEKAEEDEDKGLVVRAANLKDRAFRRSTRKLMTYTPVKSTVDNVHFAQQKIHDMTERIAKGTNYVATKTKEMKDLVKDKYPSIKTLATDTLQEGTQLVEKNWDHIYSTTMYIPKKAVQVTGEVYINAQEIVFAYTKAHSLTEIPHAVVEMAEKYYANLKIEGLSVEQVKEKAIAFVYVPAQVVSEYLRESRVVQWVIPKSIQTESIEMMEIQQNETQENSQQQQQQNTEPSKETTSSESKQQQTTCIPTIPTIRSATYAAKSKVHEVKDDVKDGVEEGVTKLKTFNDIDSE